MKSLTKLSLSLFLAGVVPSLASAQILVDGEKTPETPHFGADAFAPIDQASPNLRMREVESEARRYALRNRLPSYAFVRSGWTAAFSFDTRRLLDPQWLEVCIHNQRTRGKYAVQIWNWRSATYDVLGYVVLSPNRDTHFRFDKPLSDAQGYASTSPWTATYPGAGMLILGLQADDENATDPDFTVQWIRFDPKRGP